ncbi:MAG TPA: peptidase M23 [Microscillaceae bacterium]|nr:peptidase M23 [Microscillaceae bacterium]
MKNLFLILLILAPLFSFGQVETQAAKKVSALFEQHYNANEYQKIFDMFSDQLKARLPLETTTITVKRLKSQAGKIKHRQFIRYENETFASYKTTFERGTFALNISLNGGAEIDGLFIKPFKEVDLPKLTRNQTKLILPFEGEWTVVWGGDTPELNYHANIEAQKNAFDIVMTDKHGKSYKTNGASNEDYYAFGQKLIAPCDAEVVLVVDGIKDNKPREMNTYYVPGNTVVLKTANNEYLFFAHFKQHSIAVKQGQKVKQGELLGLCGNSGNSSEPHLHFHIQNTEDVNKATGTKCYFDKIIVNGKVKQDYSPIKADKISAE